MEAINSNTVANVTIPVATEVASSTTVSAVVSATAGDTPADTVTSVDATQAAPAAETTSSTPAVATADVTPPAITEATPPKKGKGKRVAVKVKRGKGSFRPGMEADTKQPTLHKTLKVIVASKDGVTSDAEMNAVRKVMKDLSKASGLDIKAVGFNDQAWQGSLDMQTVAVDKSKYDEVLTNTFKAMDDTIKASTVLTEGFLPLPRPSWAFMIGDFEADSGTF